MKTIRLLALAFTALAALAVPAHAQVVTPNPAPTIIRTAPYTITQPGYYQLGADLYYAGNSNINNDAIITIAASNVTLDFAGHYISGPANDASGLTGVYANEQGNLIIENGTIAYCFRGVFLNGNNTASSININQRVSNMSISYCYNLAIAFIYASNCDALNCRVSFINSTTRSYSTYGIYCLGTGFKVSNNEITTVTGAGNNGVGINGGSTTFSIGNTISNCRYGISGGKFQNNLTSGCTYPFSGTDAGNNN